MSAPGYAMQNESAVNSLFSLNNPFSLLTWTHPLLEALLLLGSLLALIHAVGLYKKGQKWPLQAWIAIIVHAIFWEITVFNFEEYLATFWHGEFSIMLYHNRLPLYIVIGYYPALFYHALMTVNRLNIAPIRYQRVIEALLVGVVFELFYIACESLSPVTQWWQWNNNHMASQPVWLNIPANAYLWGLSYGFAYAWLSRYFFIDLPQKKSLSRTRQLINIALVGALIPVLAMVFMIPVNILVYGFKAMTAAGALIAGYFIVAMGLLLWVKKGGNACVDKLLLVFPITWTLMMAGLHLYLWDDLGAGKLSSDFTAFSGPSGSLAFSFIGLVGSAIVIYWAQLKRRS